MQWASISMRLVVYEMHRFAVNVMICSGSEPGPLTFVDAKLTPVRDKIELLMHADSDRKPIDWPTGSPWWTVSAVSDFDNEEGQVVHFTFVPIFIPFHPIFISILQNAPSECG